MTGRLPPLDTTRPAYKVLAVLAEGFAAEIAKAPEANWMVQPTINSAPAGFVATRCALNERTARTPEVLAAADKSLSALTGTGRLGSFDDC